MGGGGKSGCDPLPEFFWSRTECPRLTGHHRYEHSTTSCPGSKGEATEQGVFEQDTWFSDNTTAMTVIQATFVIRPPPAPNTHTHTQTKTNKHTHTQTQTNTNTNQHKQIQTNKHTLNTNKHNKTNQHQAFIHAHAHACTPARTHAGTDGRTDARMQARTRKHGCTRACAQAHTHTQDRHAEEHGCTRACRVDVPSTSLLFDSGLKRRQQNVTTWSCPKRSPEMWLGFPILGFGKGGLLEKGSLQKSPFSRDSREFRDPRDPRKDPDCGRQRRIRPFSRDSREFRDFRDSRDSSNEKTAFVMTPFSCPDLSECAQHSHSTGVKTTLSGLALRNLRPPAAGSKTPIEFCRGTQ